MQEAKIAADTKVEKVPTICPTCKGTGSLPLPFYGYGTTATLEAAICPQCLGTGNVGFSLVPKEKEEPCK